MVQPMKFTLSWLKDHLDTTASVEELAEKLSSMGLEVESIDDPGKKLAAFTIARVLDAKQHPNADRLRVCKVDTGSGVVEVVCGAPNAKSGMIGVFAPMGSYIPGTGITLEAKPVRGVVSNGMLVSERELELSDSHEGIIELDASLGSKLGQRYADVLGLGEPVIEVKLTPNRPDCTGVRGIARDLAAAGLGKLKPEKKITGVEGDYDCPVDIKLDFPPEARDACPCFAGRYIRGVKNGPAPAWMQQRLKAVGLRPINALVDVTNYISLDRGRPLHVYDADKLKGAIRARLGKKGEKVPRPRRQDLRGRRHHVRDRRRPRGAGLRRHPRRRGHRLYARDQEHPDRMRLLRSAAHRRHRPQGRRAERRTLSLRARRRSGFHQARSRPCHGHDAGGGRRQAVEGEDRRRAARVQEGHRFLLRHGREARRHCAAGEADPHDARSARLCGRSDHRIREGDGAELAPRHPWRRRSRRGGRPHRRPRQGAVRCHAAPERRSASGADGVRSGACGARGACWLAAVWWKPSPGRSSRAAQPRRSAVARTLWNWPIPSPARCRRCGRACCRACFPPCNATATAALPTLACSRWDRPIGATSPTINSWLHRVYVQVPRRSWALAGIGRAPPATPTCSRPRPMSSPCWRVSGSTPRKRRSFAKRRAGSIQAARLP